MGGEAHHRIDGIEGELQQLYGWLADLAARRLPAPSNRMIAQRIGRSLTTGVQWMAELRRRGWIEVLVISESARRIRITATGALTANTRQAPPGSSTEGEAGTQPGGPPQRDPERAAQLLKTALRPQSTGWRPRSCQYLAGNGPFTDADKCGAAVQEGSPYCAEHHTRCHLRRTKGGDTKSDKGEAA
ncbi:hypothetical protein [Fodinicurvata fenggangensis]|uniref:hypothetical protein n=1 Tax=Fodinicurvata fenggangensis TaxID=1121830 RepID=UPI00047D5AA7|nr:hypothetical protein [Fodinicurvata fenggangensis]